MATPLRFGGVRVCFMKILNFGPLLVLDSDITDHSMTKTEILERKFTQIASFVQVDCFRRISDVWIHYTVS